MKNYINCSNRQQLVVLMNRAYDELNTAFVKFWSCHRQFSSCGAVYSQAFVTDGFQKASKYICSNSNVTVHTEELGM